MPSLRSVFLILLLLLELRPVLCGTAELEELIAKMEEDVVDLARQVETLYESRCTTALEDCYQNNYENCLSELANPTCPESEQFVIEACHGCGALFDYSVSTVMLPSEVADGEDGNPTDPQTIESICYSRQLDTWFQDKMDMDASYWAIHDVESPQMFFGASDGSFRIYPGRRFSECGTYDPRERPWYIAASSGPKNIVLVLDTSGSMSGQRLALLKQAAKRVVSTLTVGDRVAIVQFNGDAKLIADSNGRMFTATDENIKKLDQEIDRFEALGSTNFYDAFQAAFSVLENTVEQELHADCNSAILFLTDGEMTDPEDKTEADVINLVTEGLGRTTDATGNPVVLFAYSVSEDDDVHAFPKQLACSTEYGVWSLIVDPTEIMDSLTSYYTLFALGLGQGRNEGFVAWVEPYPFATGGVLGTTVSAPVYDRSTEPALFVGAVGFDFTLAAMDAALGLEAGNQETLDRVVLASTAKCPSLNLTLCELESFRRQGSAGNEALCTTNCTESDFVKTEAEQCPFVADYPRDLWDNTNNQGMGYEESVCCLYGETQPSPECLASESSDETAIIAGVVVAAVAVALIAVLAFVVWRRQNNRNSAPKPATRTPASTAAEQPRPTYPLPPPIAPGYSRASAPPETRV